VVVLRLASERFLYCYATAEMIASCSAIIFSASASLSLLFAAAACCADCGEGNPDCSRGCRGAGAGARAACVGASACEYDTAAVACLKALCLALAFASSISLFAAAYLSLSTSFLRGFTRGLPPPFLTNLLLLLPLDPPLAFGGAVVAPRCHSTQPSSGLSLLRT
jgi:hypothetical protein